MCVAYFLSRLFISDIVLGDFYSKILLEDGNKDEMIEI